MRFPGYFSYLCIDKAEIDDIIHIKQLGNMGNA